MSSIFESDSRIVAIAIILAVTIGIFTSVFFIVVNRDSYSSIYVVPESIINTRGNTTLVFEYGVVSSETSKTDYLLDTYLNGEIINKKQFSLNPGEILEERQRIILPPEMHYPSNVSLRLSNNQTSEEIHFWLR